MGFVHFGDDGWLVDAQGAPFYVVGVNYVASYVCTNFFDDWRPDVLRRDLEKIAELGFNAVRIPIFWGFAEPEEGVFNPLIFERLDAFLGWAGQLNLYVMPWFLVGIATVQKDIPYRNGRPYFEGGMLFAAENHLRTFARRYKDDQRILFWDICDEPEFYARNPGAEQLPYDAPRFKHWLEHMYRAFRSEDPNHVVTCGFGEIATENYGYNLRDAADVLDAMSVTCYPYDSSLEGLDTMRNNYYLGFYVKMNTLSGKPVFTCEAPGFSNVGFSEAMIGRYFNVSLYSNLLCGSTGVLPWCYNDFAPEILEGAELDQQPMEPYFGIITNDGRLKPSGQALQAFGEFVRAARITDYRLAKPSVGVLIPDGYYDDVYHAKRKLRAAMQFAKGCGADMEFVWEDRDFGGYDALVVPAIVGKRTGSMRTSTWRRLLEYVKNGGTLVHSYDGIKGLSIHHAELFGVEVETRSRDFGFDAMRFERAFGAWKPGDEAALPVQGRDEWLRVKVAGGEAVASFEGGAPALVRNHVGKGTAWLMTAQLHSGAFEMPYDQYIHHPLFALYDAILAEAGAFRPARYVLPELETGLLEGGAGRHLLICVNHGRQPLTARLALHPSLIGKAFAAFGSGEKLAVSDGMLELSIDAANAYVVQIDDQ